MKKYLIYITIITATLLVTGFTSCISSEDTGYLQKIKAKNLSMKPFEDYKLSVGDIIVCYITCSDRAFASDFNGVISAGSSMQGKSLTIYEDGVIIIPFFGNVKIAGLTLQQAEQAIQKKMQESILDAQVKIDLSTNFFYILSKEQKGTYKVYKDNLTIFQALAISGQTTEKMDISQVNIIRKDVQGNSVVKKFDLRSQDIIESEYYYIKPNDIIYFPTNKNAFFNITSLNSFFTTIMTPLTFLLFAATYKF